MFPLDSSPRKSAKMRRRPSVQVDVEHANSAPRAPRRRTPGSRTHTFYKDLVATLRGNGEVTQALLHYQQTGKRLGHGLGVVERKEKQKLAEPRTREPEANSDDYGSMFEEDLSGSFGGMTMGSDISEQNKLVHQVHASGKFVKSPERALFKMDTLQPQADDATATKTVKSEGNVFGALASMSDEPTPFVKSIIERYPYPDEVVTERTDDNNKALFDGMPSSKKCIG